MSKANYNPLAIQSLHDAKKKKSGSGGGFESMGLSMHLLNGIKHMGYKVPTPIQRKSIPIIMNGSDVVAMARTGSGKTAAFLIPLIERLKCHCARVGARALILSPSRELALQTLKFFKSLAKHTDLRASAFVGGDSMDDQFSFMATNPDVIVATPGRLLHLLVEMGSDLKLVEYVVFDEADRLFELGFEVQLKDILHKVPEPELRQTVLFSATLPKTLIEFAKAGLKPDPILIRLDSETKISKDLQMAFFTLKPADKIAALLYLLHAVIKVSSSTQQQNDESVKQPQVLVFVSTKHHVEFLTLLLNEYGYRATCIYGSLDQTVRKINLDQFCSRVKNILVVTDVASRGVDIPILDHVINFDFSPQPKIFIHRVGRVARAGRSGWAWNMLSAEEMPYLFDLQLFLARPLVYETHVAYPPEDQLSYSNQLVTGAIPMNLYETELEWVQAKIRDNVNLQNMYRVACNGYKLYVKSRVTASPESHKRYKQLALTHAFGQGAHPLLRKELSVDQVQQQSMVAQIATFRPQETVFEIGLRGNKHESHNIMQRRRVQAAASLNKNRQTVSELLRQQDVARATLSQRTAVPSKRSRCNEEENEEGSDSEIDEMAKSTFVMIDSLKKRRTNVRTNVKRTQPGRIPKKSADEYKDSEHYLEYRPVDFDTERGYSMHTATTLARGAQTAKLGLMGDDDSLVRAAHGRGDVVWDASKHKYKRTTVGANNVKLITGESGVKLPASLKTDRFARWQKANRTSIPRTGQSELGNAHQFSGSSSVHGRFRHQSKASGDSVSPGAGTMSSGRKGKHPASEIKNVQQIVKSRKVKEKRRAKNARPSKKAKSSRKK